MVRLYGYTFEDDPAKGIFIYETTDNWLYIQNDQNFLKFFSIEDIELYLGDGKLNLFKEHINIERTLN